VDSLKKVAVSRIGSVGRLRLRLSLEWGERVMAYQ